MKAITRPQTPTRPVLVLRDHRRPGDRRGAAASLLGTNSGHTTGADLVAAFGEEQRYDG